MIPFNLFCSALDVDLDGTCEGKDGDADRLADGDEEEEEEHEEGEVVDSDHQPLDVSGDANRPPTGAASDIDETEQQIMGEWAPVAPSVSNYRLACSCSDSMRTKTHALRDLR